jgi:two-component system, OmpR family, response regulator MprA
LAGYILVIEDDKHVQQFIRMALTNEGYEVAVASDGAAALETINRRAPSMILLDIWMPTMDGYEFLTQYCATAEQDIPIIVMTADYATFANQEARNTFDGVLIKPFGFDDLINCVQEHLPRS